MGQMINFSSFKRVYLDTSIYIYYFEDNPDFAGKIEKALITFAESSTQIIASPLLLTELLVAPLRKNDHKLISIYKNLPDRIPNLLFFDFNQEVSIQAAQLRAQYNLKTPDSIHLATAIVGSADCFITTDKRFDRVREIRVGQL